MNQQDQRPNNSAPGIMGGSTRMYDPTEAGHDRVRRHLMNLAFLVIAGLNLAQWHWIGVRGWAWINVLLLVLAGVPLGLTVKLFELRFKVSTDERRLLLGELPVRRNLEFAGYSFLVLTALVVNSLYLTWALWGVWFYDFVTYYHDRPRRMRHVYAVSMILDELREFPRPWLWPVPAIVWAVAQLLLARSR